MRRFFQVIEGGERYGGKVSAWRKWVLSGALGDAVVRCGRLVLLDSTILDERLAKTGQLLISSPQGNRTTSSPHRDTDQVGEKSPNKKAVDCESTAARQVRSASATTQT